MKDNRDIQLRIKAAAERLDCGVSTVWAWAKTDPDFPPLTRIGRTTSISAKALDEYVAKKTGAAK